MAHHSFVAPEKESNETDIRSQGEDPRVSSKESAVNRSPKQASGAGNSKTANSSKPRKRTKTGCLTCRQRRIKCGEERPTCNNCVKSKRNCEGYTPRVIFKDPLGACPPGVGTARVTGGHFQPITRYNGVDAHHRPLQPRSPSQIPLPVIAPHPLQHANQSWAGMDPPALLATYYDESQYPPFEGPFYTQGDLPPPVLQQVAQRNCSLDTSPVPPETDTFGAPHITSSQYHQGRHPDRDSRIDVSYPGVTSEWSHSSTSSTTIPGAISQASLIHEPRPATEFRGLDYAQACSGAPYHSRPSAAQPHHSQPRALNHESEQNWYSYLPPAVRNCHDPTEAFLSTKKTPVKTQPGPQGNTYLNGRKSLKLHLALIFMTKSTIAACASTGHGVSSQVSSQHDDGTPQCKETKYDPTIPTHYDPSMEDPEDDYYDVTSDEEQEDLDLTMSDAPALDLGLILAPTANANGREFRSLTNFLNEPNILSTYRPSYSASPLMDPQTARVFCHFVTATAPTLSLHNRHPVDPSVMFKGHPVPAFQRSLFTYTLPMMALSNQGLLHAQLALASLHIAKLQQTSPTPSLKHYHYALRRVAKAVGHPTKRREVATLAATLLLGFFEITSAEHNKWNSHLAGARELILEIDFAGMTKRINAYKLETKMLQKSGMYNYRQDENRRIPFDILRTDKELDQNLVNVITGWQTRCDEHGQVIDLSKPPSHHHVPLTPKDVEMFEIQCDLFWWYAKQDMYQSLISGNHLLLSYDRWIDCPPRAPCGRLDAVYGSTDHLVLLFARLTEFAARDLPRKIKAQAKAEEDMRKLVSQNPPPWGPGQGSQPIANGQSSHRPPPMYGMMPAPGHVNLPSAFDQSRHDHMNEANKIIVEDAELETATRAAEHEWADICAALNVIEEAFGPDFQPLSADYMAPLSTPFGPALYYRTYSIACVWSLFFTARIFAARVAPGMPPAAMAAAGVAIPQTAHWANTIGRICAGLQPLSSTAPLNPSHGAALMDSCMSLFHAGVQFRDAAQRGWTITKLRNVARLTGWQTSALIASGCERAWMAAADMGKGPPYTRTMNAAAKDDRVSGRSRNPNPGPPKDINDRRYITVNRGARVYWAMGILSAEEDMKQLKLD
ncbi:MAG: hypothetical protein Q9201_006739 [Fulgogasparrea decipioides]